MSRPFQFFFPPFYYSPTHRSGAAMLDARTAQRVILAILVFMTAILTAQGKPPQEESAIVRNRAQDGLRGPVKSCREESTTAAVPNVHPEIRSESTTEYDREGRVSSIRHQWDSSYWIVRYEYAPSGRLLRIASGNDEKNLSV